MSEALAAFETLGTSPQVLDLARRVHPTWLIAHGHMDDPGVEGLAQEIGRCIAALEWLREQGEDVSNRCAMGSGLVVTTTVAVRNRNYQVAVTAGSFVEASPG